MLHLHTVSCDAPKADETVDYLTYNSTTLEGSNITYRCSTDVQLSTFTSVCYKNASWVPDPISQCATLQSGNDNYYKWAREMIVYDINSKIMLVEGHVGSGDN